ncbi:MAG TPA: histidine kinase [Gemmatimonadales bacterium]|nr:histidine kinase [Gemmatimonadales bacterium]
MRRGRVGIAALWLAAFTTVGLLQFTHYYLNVLAEGHSEPFRVKLVEELTAAYGAGACFVPVVWLVARARRARRGLPRTLALHAAVLPLFSVAHTSWNWATRSVLFPVLSLGRYDYGRMPLRYAMELPSDVLFYTLIMGLVYLAGWYREARDRELRLAQLEAELGQVRLEALEGQLRPHFLFNVLNTVSAVMFEDVAAADAMLARLAELLRRALRRPAGAEVVLAEELETLDLYLDIMRGRFAERLRVELQVDPEARRALVPPLVLQPLVENAVLHGDPGPDATVRIAVGARREGAQLVLAVEDNGPGITGAPAAAVGRGIGLGATQRRLAQLYGEHASVTLANVAGGGVRAVVALPFRERP